MQAATVAHVFVQATNQNAWHQAINPFGWTEGSCLGLNPCLAMVLNCHGAQLPWCSIAQLPWTTPAHQSRLPAIGA
eukprot:1160624-Pelagomonas_calceolata.AAC.11